MEDNELLTRSARLWFRAIDAADPARQGDVREWKTRVTLKHRPPYLDGDRRMVEVRAIPGGTIRYTTDGSSPQTSGAAYDGPFEISDSVTVIQAIGDFDGVASEVTRFDLPRDGRGGVVIDPAKPATWLHRHAAQTTHDAYDWIEHAGKFNAQLSGIELNVQRDDRYISLASGPKVRFAVATIRGWADQLKSLLPDGEVTITVEACHFDKGSDLSAFCGAIKRAPAPGEVAQ
jgi:hypothetical protein